MQRLVCNGAFLPVTQHLFNGLENIRRRGLCEYVWVDTVCIIQKDNVEKVKQVRRMSTFSENAQRTIIWLGAAPDGSDTNVLIDWIPRLKNALDKVNEPFIPTNDVLVSLGFPGSLSPVGWALKDMIHRPWFERLWVTREVALSRERVFLYRRRTIHWCDVARLFTAIIETQIFSA